MSKPDEPGSAEFDLSLDEARDDIAKMLFDSDWNLKQTKAGAAMLIKYGPTSKPAYDENGALVGYIDVFDKPCPPEHRATPSTIGSRRLQAFVLGQLGAAGAAGSGGGTKYALATRFRAPRSTRP
jgi:hypothetical protein